MFLVDVTPFAFGIERTGGIVNWIFPHNTTIPNETAARFSTNTNNQTTITIKLLQNEQSTRINHLIGTFDLINIPNAPVGVPIIEVTFTIDVNSILSVIF
jgi:molecular chaperone DnaK (HSP70)